LRKFVIDKNIKVQNKTNDLHQIPCIFCNTDIDNRSLHQHYITYHKNEYDTIIVPYVNKSFNDISIHSTTAQALFGLTYSDIKHIWLKKYTRSNIVRREYLLFFKNEYLKKMSRYTTINWEITCPICGKKVSDLLDHFKDVLEDMPNNLWNDYKEMYEEQKTIILPLLFDESFNAFTIMEHDEIIFNYYDCFRIWSEEYSTIDVLKILIRRARNLKRQLQKQVIDNEFNIFYNDSGKIIQRGIKCPICNRIIYKPGDHFPASHDIEHIKIMYHEYNLLATLFFDITYSKDTADSYALILPGSCVWSIYQQLFTKEMINFRQEIPGRGTRRWAGKDNTLPLEDRIKQMHIANYERKRIVNHRPTKICPVCNIQSYSMSLHLTYALQKDNLYIEHKKFNDEQIQLAKDLFNDYNFVYSSINDDKYSNLYFSYRHVEEIWNIFFTKEEINDRKTLVFNNLLDKKFPYRHTKNNTKHSKCCRCIQGFRKDIGHYAASTFEANIFRIFQYEGKEYLTEWNNLFPVIFSDGTEHIYRIDIQDIDGLLTIPGGYIEIKGYMDERSEDRTLSFIKQYPDESLITIGNSSKDGWKYDIEYNKLIDKYKDVIPLLEDKNKNLFTAPELYT
jgi:ribulose bisphosphate carboxylase small subunit